jgi:Grx4 family monothiol glutaredoxin
MNQTFEQLSTSYPNFKFLKIAAEELSEITEKYEVSVVPSFIFLRNGKVLDKIDGANGPDLINKLTKYSKEEPASAEQTPKEDINTRLQKLVTYAPVMLFMKGVPSAPQCGFSSKIVDILKKNNIKFSSFNILTDEEVRNGLKTYSNWPTYPQLYVNGKLVGGLDIVKEMSEEGELLSMIPADSISSTTPTPTEVKSDQPIASAPAPAPKEDLNTRLGKLVNSAPVMLFMKGTPEAPKCGFSGKIVDILNKHNAKYSSFNILADEEVRNGLKTYSNWPTYPQLYAKGKLVGGLDIVKELSEEGELDAVLAP